MGFSLSGMIAGAGKGAADVGEKLVGVEATRLATLDIDKERAAVQALRDDRLMAHTTTERVAGEGFKAKESGLERGMKERQHTETVEASQKTVDAASLKSATDVYIQAQRTLAALPGDVGSIDAVKDARTALDRARAVMDQRSKRYSGTKAKEEKTDTPTDGKRDWRAFAPGAKAGAVAATAEKTVAPETPAGSEAPPVGASTEPTTGALNEITAPDKSPFERAASSVGGIINSARTAGYKPGVSKEAGESQDIRPGMTLNVGGKRLTVMNYLKDSTNGAVWRVRDENGKMYEYVAPLK